MTKKIKALLSIILSPPFLLLLGCAPEFPQGISQYNFDPQDNTGIVAYSVTCNVGRGLGSFAIQPLHESTSLKLAQIFISEQIDRNSLPFICTAPNNPTLLSDLRYKKLPAGNYAIATWGVSLGLEMTGPDKLTPIAFTVPKHKVIYIGSFNLFNVGTKYMTQITNDQIENNIAKLKTQLPNISKDKFIVDITHFTKQSS